MSKRLLFILALMLVAGVMLAGGITVGYTEEMTLKTSKSKYHCPMHPHFVSDTKGRCGICGMDLVKNDDEAKTKDSMGMDYVPVYEEKDASSGVLINTNKQQLIGVKKDIVQQRSLIVEISTVGKVAYDPDLYVAQEEYVQALKAAAAAENSALESIREQSAGLLVSAKRKLLLLGMSMAEVEALKNSGMAQGSLFFPDNSGQAWIYMTVYEYEMGLVREGQEVVVDAVAFPGEMFKGKIVALTPVLNAQSRSVRVRAEVEDKDGRLKPEMFVNAKIEIVLGDKLAIPHEAVMDSGTRRIVYVVKDNRFVAREVTLGAKAGDFYEVLAGLKEGEEVVISGNFLIDAESKLKGAL
ncbi:MAG: efflux RND transporter periplasmic adaptor subunit [Candidatus Omnitrophota bacterium]